MIKIIDRYVTKHLLVSYGICLASILGIFIVVDTLTQIERLLGRGSFLQNLCNYLLASIPMVYYQIAPGTFLMAAMFTLSSLNKNNELLALMASGVSIYRVLQPVIIASLVAAVVMAAVQEVIIPAEADIIRRVDRDRPISCVLLADTGGNVFRINKYFPYEARMEDVVVTVFRPEGSKQWSIHADTADHVEGGWLLRDVRLYEQDKEGMLKVARDRETGARMPYASEPGRFFRTDIVPSDVESADRDVNYLSFSQLNSQYHRQKYLPHLRVKLHSRIAFPFASFVLLLLGVPFALRSGRKALLLNVTVCIVVACSFFVVTFFFADLGADGRLSPISAAWLPVVIFTAIGLGFIESVRT